jgi:hypothetical protein
MSQHGSGRIPRSARPRGAVVDLGPGHDARRAAAASRRARGGHRATRARSRGGRSAGARRRASQALTRRTVGVPWRARGFTGLAATVAPDSPDPARRFGPVVGGARAFGPTSSARVASAFRVLGERATRGSRPDTARGSPPAPHSCGCSRRSDRADSTASPGASRPLAQFEPAPAREPVRASDERAASPASPRPSRPLARFEPARARRFDPLVAGVAWDDCLRDQGSPADAPGSRVRRAGVPVCARSWARSPAPRRRPTPRVPMDSSLWRCT